MLLSTLLMMTVALAMPTYDDDHDKDEGADDDHHHDGAYIVLFLFCSSPPFSPFPPLDLMSSGTCRSCRLPCLVFLWTRRENEAPTKNRKNRSTRILKSRDIRQVHSKRRVEVNCRNRDSVREDVCACLACAKTFPRSLTIQEETRRCHSYFIHMISRTSSESDSSCNSVSNAIGSVNGLMSFISSLLNKDALLAFRRLLTQT